MSSFKQKVEYFILALFGILCIFIVLPSIVLAKKGYRIPFIESAAYSANEKRLIDCYRFYSEIQGTLLIETVDNGNYPYWRLAPVARKYIDCRPDNIYQNVKRRICIDLTSECGYLNASIDMNKKLAIAELDIARANVNAPMVRYREKRQFKGYECTDDCSGHKAGYDWARRNSIYYDSDCPSDRNISFYEGCLAYVEE